MVKLKIEASEGGTTNPKPGTYEYSVGSVVTVTAIPDPGYVFSYWRLGDAKKSTDNPISITLTSDAYLEAMFGRPVTIALDKVYPRSTCGHIEAVGQWSGKKVTLREGQSSVFEDEPICTYFVPDSETDTGYKFLYWRELIPYESVEYHYNPVCWGGSHTYRVWFQSTRTYHVSIRKQGECNIYDPPDGRVDFDLHKYDVFTVGFIEPQGWYLEYVDVNGTKYTPSIDPSTNTRRLALTITSDTTITIVTGKWLKVEGYLGAGSGYVVVNADGRESNWVMKNLKKGMTVKLTAYGLGGYVFDYFVINGVKYTDNPVTFTLQDDVVFYAYFKSKPPAKAKLGIAAMTGGTTNPSPGTYEYDVNAKVTVSAIPGSGYEFDYWTLDGTKYFENPITVTMNKDHTLTAYFKSLPPPSPGKARLTIVTTEGGTTVPPPGTYEYDKDTVVTIKAFPSSGYYFDYWLLDETKNTSNPISVKMDADHKIVAYFKSGAPPPPAKAKLGIAAMTGGTTNPSPGTYEYDVNAKVTVSAIPGSGYAFDYWWLDGTKFFENPITITMDKDHALVAYFKSLPPPSPGKARLTIVTTEGGTTDPPPGTYEYSEGTGAVVTAIPSSGYDFDYWLLNGARYTDNPITITMVKDSTLTAYFKKKPIVKEAFPILLIPVLLALMATGFFLKRRKKK